MPGKNVPLTALRDYPKSYIICNKTDANEYLDAHFIKIQINNDIVLYYSNDQEFNHLKKDHIEIYSLGPIYFVNEDECHCFALPRLLKQYFENGEEAFFNELNYMGGRYILIFVDQIRDIIYILGDAQGLRTCFYSTTKNIASSHLELLNSVCNEPFSEIYQLNLKINFAYEWPGGYTKYKNIKFLRSNFYLDLLQKSIYRFYPCKQARNETSIVSVKNKILKKFHNQLIYLSKQKPLLVSLTGGKDSRVTLLSMGLDLAKNSYFYTEARDNDLTEAERIVNAYDLNWVGIDIKDFDLTSNSEYLKYHNKLNHLVFPSSIKFALKSQFILFNLFENDKFIHIHSNGAETGRGRARIYAKNSQDFTLKTYIDEFVYISTRYKSESDAKTSEKLIRDSKVVLDAITEDYQLLANSNIANLGYNPWDFAYMETRTPYFLSGIHVMNDYIFESISLTNTRDILFDMWSLPDAFINKSNVLYNSILKQEKLEGTSFIAQHSHQTDLSYSGEFIVLAYYINKKYAESIATAKNVISNCDSISLDTYIYGSLSAIAMNDSNELKYFVDKLSAINAKDIKSINNIEQLINKLRTKKSYLSFALTLCKNLTNKYPNVPWLYKQLSHIYESMGENELSFMNIIQAIKLKPNDYWSAKTYCRLLFSKNKINELNSYLETLTKYNFDFVQEYKP